MLKRTLMTMLIAMTAAGYASTHHGASQDLQNRPPQQQHTAQSHFTSGKHIDFRLKDIQISGAKAIEKNKMLRLFSPILHRKISLETLQTYVLKITHLYLEHGYLLSHAYLPPQTIDGGHVKITVVEGFVGKIDIQGHITAQQRHLIHAMSHHLMHQTPLKNTELEQALLQINAVPGIQARAILGKHRSLKRASQLTLLIKPLKDTYHVQWYNGGNTLNHHDLFNMAYTMQLPAWSGKLDLQTTLAKNIKDHKAFVVQPTFATGHRANIFKVTLSELRNKPNYTSIGLPSNGEQGKTKHSGMSWQHMFHRTRSKAIGMTLALDHTDTSFSNAVANAFHDVTTDFSAALQFKWPIRLWKPSTMTGAIKWVKGLNVLGAQADNPSRIGGRVNYSKIDVNLLRHTQLGKHFTLINHFHGQFSRDVLLSSSEFSAGGFVCGRGYDGGELMGDNGFCRRHQLEMSQQNQSGQPIVMYMFYDKAKIWNNAHASSNQIHTSHMSSNGFGLRFWAMPHVTVNVFVAHPLNHDVTLENNRSSRYFFSLTYMDSLK